MNDDNPVVVRYQGIDADSNQLDIRYLGQSLIGIERILSVGLATIDTGQIPKGRIRFPIFSRAYEPVPGSFEINLIFDNIGFLPFFSQIPSSGRSRFIWNWLVGVILNRGGREFEALGKFKEMTDMLSDPPNSQLMDYVKSVEQNRHDEVMEITRLMDRLAEPAKHAVSPVGRSCRYMNVSEGTHIEEIDLPTAYAVRSRTKLEVGEMENITVQVDGFFHSTKQLKIIHPDEPSRFVTAIVGDPAFEIVPNVYTEAASVGGKLNVTCKVMRKEGKIHRVHISDARSISELGSDR